MSLNGFKTEPGRLSDHLAANAEALGHLQRLGQQVATLQVIAGTDVDTIVTVLNYADNAAYASAVQAIQADPGWQEFWIRVGDSGAAQRVESSLFVDIDPNFQASADRPLGVVTTTQWRAKDGRTADFMAKVLESVPLIEKMGGQPRVLQSVVGAYPMTVMIGVAFADLDAYGAYADRIAADPEWQAFWAGAMLDPTANMVRSGVYVNIGDN